MYSRYNIYLKDHPYKDYTTIYNLLTGNIGCYISTNLIKEPEKQVKRSLQDKRFWIEDREKEICISEENYLVTINDKETLSIMLVLTGTCNLRCSYCYEADNMFLPEQFNVVESLKKFIKEKYDEAHFRNLRIIFYGGEPLIRHDLISEISMYCHETYKDIFSFSIITNPWLFIS